MLAGFGRHRPHMGVSRERRADLAVLRSKDELLESIDAHIAQDRSELEQARSTGDKSKAAHLEAELKDLEAYKAHHPEESKDPTPMEVYCDLNPEAPGCLVYDD